MPSTQQTHERIEPKDLGIYDLKNIHTPAEANAHLVYRASEVIEQLGAPNTRYSSRAHRSAMTFYRDSKRFLQEEKGLSAEIIEACDRVIRDLEKITGRKL